MFQISPDQPLNFAPRGSVTVDSDEISRLARDDGPGFAAALYSAEIAGDQQAILHHTLTYLREQTSEPIGRSRDRLIVGAVLAQLSDPATVADLASVPAQIGDAKVIVQINDATWSRRRPGALDDPFNKASARLTTIKDELVSISSGLPRRPWALTKELGACGAFPLAEAIATALQRSGNGSHAQVAYAAARRHSGDPNAAIRICDAVLKTELNPAAFVCKGASLGDVGDYQAAFDSVCLGLALRPNEYAGRAGWRAFRHVGAAGREYLNGLVLACETGLVPPGNQVSLDHYCRELAAGALASAGRHDLVETALLGARRADPRSLRIRHWCDEREAAAR